MTNNYNTSKMPNILVTGGTGYIGSHTVTSLLEKGYNVTIIDNLVNSNIKILSLIQKITHKKPKFYKIDLCDKDSVEHVFQHQHFDAIIHFAALKSSPESIEKPNLYYYNNLTSLLNLIEFSLKYKVKNFIFNSVCF
jgi:UDP-glucose 4-epimerase